MVAKYFYDAEPHWPEDPRAPDGAPNVVVIVLDDVGFAQLGCYGSDIATPHIDALAAEGLRYTNFHTTALCSASRASLLTGRNHHRNGMGRVIELATGFPGYNARIPRSSGFLSEALLAAGYATMAVGKWHLTPEEECHAGASRRRWPLGRGFERFYGFMSGENHQFAPTLYRDNHILRNADVVTEGYHLTTDLVEQALQFVTDVRSVAPDKPYFLYFCTGACHSPHQAPREWIEAYRGRFSEGWDAWREAAFARQRQLGIFEAGAELSPRPDWVPPWSSLSPDEQHLYARYMEAFAGYLSHTDAALGDLFSQLRQLGGWDNTLVVLLSDNGASSEGGPTGSLNDLGLWNRMTAGSLETALARIDDIGGSYLHNNYPWGWTVAGNTPFRRWKREVHEGGVADPLIIRWPQRDVQPGLRRQYVHVIDIMPTILSVAGVKPPQVLDGVAQSELDGLDFSGSFTTKDAASRRHMQYYEMFGSRALYKDGWKAVTYHAFGDTTARFADDAWELYFVDEDPAECHDLAEQQPERLREMVEDWWIEAARNQVLPLDNRPFSSWVTSRPGAARAVADARYVYYPQMAQIPEVSAVNVRGRWHRVEAEVVVGSDCAPLTGTIISQGSALGGWALYLLPGELLYVHNLLGMSVDEVRGKISLTAGSHLLWSSFEPSGDGGGHVEVGVGDRRAAAGRINSFTPIRFSLTGAGLTCGYSNALPVSREIRAPFEFSGQLSRVVVKVRGPELMDPWAEAWSAIVSQ
jgi:arylsulfatase A-like enzyme